MPLSAAIILRLPSNAKGFVTTATVRIPMLFAISATIGAAPVPVPPPIPAVINTISTPVRSFVISSRLSVAAFSPTSGFAPAPRPLVSFSPSCIFVPAFDFKRTCLSVFIVIKSTLVIPDSIILSTALFPPPPIPITMILASLPASLSYSILKISPP